MRANGEDSRTEKKGKRNGRRESQKFFFERGQLVGREKIELGRGEKMRSETVEEKRPRDYLRRLMQPGIEALLLLLHRGLALLLDDLRRSTLFPSLGRLDRRTSTRGVDL
jgi:hypothetical protein